MGVLDSPWGELRSKTKLRDVLACWLSIRARQDFKQRQESMDRLRADREDFHSRNVVRTVYNEQLGQQEDLLLKPEQFAATIRTRLIATLQGASEGVDHTVAQRLLEAALAERERWIATATFGKDKPGYKSRREKPIAAYEFLILADGQQMGNVTYTVCTQCHQGVLDNITVDPDLQCGGVASRALRELERRWPGYTFNTTGQRSTAKGFYDRYRTTSSSPWRSKLDGCVHLAHCYGVQ